MTLSNRLWHAIAHRVKDSDEDIHITLWAKIEHHAKGKRHFLNSLPLTVDEELAALRVINEASDDYFRAILAHERETNPELAA